MTMLTILAGGGFFDMNIVFIIAMFAVIFIFMILPQQRKAKAQQKYLDELKKGDEVVTSAGMIGKVSNIEGNIITLSLDGKTTAKFTKGSISQEMTAAFHDVKEAKK